MDLNIVVANVDKMLSRVLGKQIEISTKTDPRLWPIAADHGQMEQVLMNLCLNARDAMPRGGILQISTYNATFEEADSNRPALRGEQVVLEVSDNGLGMDGETLARIFEPFFTTKELGKGTGLGLAMVYGITHQNSGEILVHSTPGQGTIFQLYFPRTNAKTAEEARPVSHRHETLNARVLLVDDESPVRSVASRYLQYLGLSVVDADGPFRAIALAAENKGRIDLLLTDIHMPQMNGFEVARRVVELAPGVKVIYMSGIGEISNARGQIQPGQLLLQKPFLMEDLERVLLAALPQTRENAIALGADGEAVI